MSDHGIEGAGHVERRPRLARDIEIRPPEGPIPVSRAGTERALRRIDRYDRRAVVTAYETLTTTGTVRITFRVTDDQPFDFVPGQFVGIRANVAGFGTRRSPYCIVSPPNNERTFQLLVRLVPEGPLSIYLASLRIGDGIEFRGPSGRHMLPKEVNEDFILLATGVGVGPLMSLVDELGRKGIARPAVLYWGLRKAEDICLVDELDELVRRYPFFSYQISLSQPPDDWTGLRGRLTETVPPLLPTLAGKRYYLVGNGAMIEEMATVLSDLGVDRVYIYEEVYFNVRYRPEPAVLNQIRERFAASDLFSPHAHLAAGLFVPGNRAPC